MNNFNNLFNYHTIEKLRELVQEENDKKYEYRRNNNKNYANNNNQNKEKNGQKETKINK